MSSKVQVWLIFSENLRNYFHAKINKCAPCLEEIFFWTEQSECWKSTENIENIRGEVKRVSWSGNARWLCECLHNFYVFSLLPFFFMISNKCCNHHQKTAFIIGLITAYIMLKLNFLLFYLFFFRGIHKCSMEMSDSFFFYGRSFFCL